MKTMKNVLMLLLGIALVFSFAGAGAGAELLPSTNDENEVPVTYSQAGSYEVTLPESITLDKDAGVRADVSVTSLELADGWNLLISVASKNGWKISDGTSEFAYKMSYYSGNYAGTDYFGGDSTNVNAEEDILLIRTTSGNYFGNIADAGGNTGGWSYLNFELTDDPGFGEYTDTLTFTISTSNSAPQVNMIDELPDWIQ